MPDAGLIGGALTGAANAYFEALHGPSLAEERAARERKARSEEVKIKLDEAHAAYFAREQARALRNRQVIQDKAGNWYEVPSEGGPPSKLLDAPDVAQKLKDQREATIMKAMETRMGGRTMDQWSPEEIAGSVLRPYWELLGQGRSPYAVITDKGDVILKEQYVPKDRVAPSPPGGQMPAQPQGRTPATTDPQPPATTTTRPPAAPEIVDVQSNPQRVDYYVQRFGVIPRAQADKEVTAIMQTPGMSGEHIASIADAYQRVHGTTPPGWSVQGDATAKPDPVRTDYTLRWKNMPQAEVEKQLAVLRQTPGIDPANLAAADAAYETIFGKKPPGAPAVAVSKPSSSTTGTPPTTPPPQSTSGAQGRPRNVPLTKEALEEEERKRRDQQIQEEMNARAGEQLTVSQGQLAETRRMNDARIAQMDVANKQKDAAAAAKIEQDIFRDTRDLRGSIQGVDETVALLSEMRRYVEPATVGVRGAVRASIQSLMGQLEGPPGRKLSGAAGEMQRRAVALSNVHVREAALWQADENTRAAQEGRAPTVIYVPDYSRYDPRMRFIDFLKEVIAYSHARAMNGPGRLTDQDLNRAQRSLGIDSWWNSAADMQSSIAYVERQLKNKRVRTEALQKEIERNLRKNKPGATEPESGQVEPPKED